MSLATRFCFLSRTDKRLFLEAVLLSYAAKIILSLLPFRRCLPLLKSDGADAGIPQLMYPGKIKKAIYRSRRCTPWKNKCLTMSMASRWMLQRRGIPSRLFLGVGFDAERKLKAHAWLGAAGIEVVEKGGNYQEMYSV